MDNSRDRALSFGQRSELYDRVRPTYPSAAVAAVVPADGRRVADVGAGTGKLSAALVARGIDVIAVEPDPAMRAVLHDRLPDVAVRAGVGEELPLADGSVDAVLYGQSWHWVDPARAAAEARRVLRAPAGAGVLGMLGMLGMLWNMLDDRVRWVAELNDLTGGEAIITQATDPPVMADFVPGHRVDVPWSQRLTATEIVDLVQTWSTVSTRSAVDRDAVLDRVRQLLERTPGLSGQNPIDLPYVCTTWGYRLTRAGTT